VIQEFVKRFEDNRGKLAELFRNKHPDDYNEVVKNVVSIITDDDEYASIDPARIHSVDDGEYQGTLVFVIGAKGYQPSDYWYVKVSYGSCSGCDTLQAISGYSDEPPDDEQVKDYMTLALHIVQGLKKMGEGES
jgi:hypothetical protein